MNGMEIRARLPALTRDRRRLMTRLVVVAMLTVSALAFLAPLYWLFSAAFRPPTAVTIPPRLFPSGFTTAHIQTVLTETSFGTYLRNSVLVSTATVLGTLAVAVPAGYALSRYRLPHETTLMTVLLGVQMIPIVAMILPLFQLFAFAGVLDSLAVVALTDTVLVVPVATWLLKGYFDTLPPGLEEAARVGGATEWRTFRLMVPLAKPAIGGAALFAFVRSWNQFIVPLTFTFSESTWTFPVGLYGFISRRGVVEWGLLGAASLVAMLPVVALYFAFQRQFVAGLTGGGMKQ